MRCLRHLLGERELGLPDTGHFQAGSSARPAQPAMNTEAKSD